MGLWFTDRLTGDWGQDVVSSDLSLLFMAAFFGSAAACIPVGVSALFRWSESGAVYLLIGSMVYLIGTIPVTMAFNVPRNDALATVDPQSTEGASLWAG